jgi:PAS domain S-box-containing protein
LAVLEFQVCCDGKNIDERIALNGSNERQEALHVSKEMLDGLLGRFEDSALEVTLQRWATGGIVVAIVLISFMGFLSWRGTRMAEEDADWVGHTHSVKATLTAALGHVVDIETGARGFEATGQDVFLEPYSEGQRALAQDLETLRRQTADNPTQQKWLAVLESDTQARIEFARETVNERQRTGRLPSRAAFLEGKRRMDAVRATVAEMQNEETRLLDLRIEKTREARRTTRIIAVGGTLVGVVFLMLAGFSIRRELDRSGRLRGQLKALNVNLEQRVEQRTAALRESEQKYRTLFESMDEGFCTIQVLFDEDNTPVDYRFLEVNPAFEKHTGIANAPGRTMREIAPQHEEYWFQIYGKIALTGEPARIENEAAQLHRWYEVHAFRVGDPRERKLAVVFNDITERKRREGELRESEERFRLFAEHAPAALAMFDREMRYLHLSRRWRTDYGLGERDLRGVSHYEIFPEMPKRWKEIHRRGMAGEVLRAEADRFDRLDGVEQWIRWEVRPWHDRTGAIAGIVIFAEDITERKQAEEALRESEERFRTLIEQASDAFFLHDGDGRFLEVNRQACESLGYTRKELLGMCVFNVEQDFDLRKAQLAWEQGEPGKAYTLQGHQRRKDGTAFPVEVRLSAYYMGGQKLHLGLARDITERKLAEEALRQSDAGRKVALEAAKLGEWEIDLNTRETRRSVRHAEIFGYAPPLPDWSFDAFLSHVHPDDREGVGRSFEAAVSQGAKLETECRIIRPNGEMRWILACGDRYEDASGHETRMFGTVEDITERKNAAEALRLSEERLRLALDGARLGTWHWDLESGELVWSPSCLALFGLPPGAQMSYEIFLGALHPDDRVPTDEAVRRSLAEHTEYDIEYRALWPDGSEHWIAAKGQGYYDAAGEAVRMEGVVMEVTERKRAEAALRESETNFRGLANLVPPFVWICTNDGLNVYFNDRWFQYTGLTPEQSYGTGWNTPFHPDDKQPAWDAWNHATATGETYRIESRLRAADGNYRWFLMLGEALRDNSGKTIKWFGTCTDIQDMKLAQEALRESEERFQAMANGIPQLAWMAEPDGHIFWYNQRWYEYTGTTFEQMEGWGWQSVHDPGALPRVLEKWKGAIAAGQPFDMEFPLRGADGVFRAFLTRVMPLKDAEGRVTRWFGTNTDISERKQAEREIRRLNDELEQRVLQRTAELQAANQEMEAFTYSVSHDLRAPLRHISGFSKILSEEYGPSLAPDAQRHLQRIQQGTLRMGQLVDDLLNLARVGRLELSLQSSGLRPIVDDLIAELAPECAGRQIEWKIGNLPWVECDPGLIKQVLQNLLTNALKFTRPRPRAVIEVGQKDEQGGPVLFVRDNGVGFNMKYADKLFGVFQRLHRAEDFEGTGVGLATVQRIIQKHGGRIWAEAELDKGATFYFTLGSSQKDEFKTKAAMVGERT